MDRVPMLLVTHEATEDRFAVADNLLDAVRAAKEAAAGPVGELVLVEANGVGLRQFSLRPDGAIDEIAIAPVPEPTAKAS